MSDGCSSCIGSGPGLDKAQQNAIDEAGKLSKEKKIPVAVFHENGEWKWEEAFSVYKRGLGPIVREVVSKHC